MNTFNRQVALSLLALLPPGAGAADTGVAVAVSPIASFSSIHQDSEHCAGHKLDVWRTGAAYLGLFSLCSGMTGDIVTSVAAISQFDSASGAIAFEARLSQGTDYLKGGVEAPSKDHFTFLGHLAGDEITGTLTWTDDNYPTHKPKTFALHLHRASATLPKFNSEATWRQHAEQLASPTVPASSASH
jgi:hypothetical protein